MNVPLEVKGYTGQLTVTEEKIIIQRKGIGGFLSRGILSGDKEIPIKSITAIQFRKAGMLTNGSIQFSIHGEIGHKGGGISKVSDENTLIFTKKQSDRFLKAKEVIEELMRKVDISNKSVVQQLSGADELQKFAELKEQGIISEEEFNIKKKKLLGL